MYAINSIRSTNKCLKKQNLRAKKDISDHDFDITPKLIITGQKRTETNNLHTLPDE